MPGLLDPLLTSPSLRPLRWAQLLVALGIYGYAYLAPQPVGAGLADDKTLHVIGSAMLFLSLFVAAHEHLRLLTIVVLASAIGFAFEYAQSFSVMRVFDWADLVGNLIGVAIGTALLLVARRLRWISPGRD